MNIIFDAKILHKLIFLLVVVTCVFGCIRLMCVNYLKLGRGVWDVL